MNPLVVIGTGESVTFDKIDLIRHSVCDVMVVNESFIIAPWADYLYASDPDWWEKYSDCVQSTFHGDSLAVEVTNRTYKDHPYKKLYKEVNDVSGKGGLELDSSSVRVGGNSGHAALNAAYHLGYGRIILLGLDGQGGYWFKREFRASSLRNDVKAATRTVQAHTLNGMIEDLEKHGVVVHNCSSTALDLKLEKLEDVI